MKRWIDPSWTQDMKVEININMMMRPLLDEKEGLEEEDIEKLVPALLAIHEQINREKEEGRLLFLTLPSETSQTVPIKKYVQHAKSWAENFVVLGIGGSAIGAQALQTALGHPHYNLLSKTMRKGFPRLFVADNVDPDGFKALLDILEVRKTLFNVVSKSGETAETLSRFLIIRDLLKKRLGTRKEKDHLVITTDPVQGALRKIVETEQLSSFAFPAALEGRFSVLSAAGLLPAAMCGIDIEELLAGAREMAGRCQTASPWENPAYLCAALSFLSNKQKKKSIRVVMAYADALKGLGDWFCQLWAESLGKKWNSKGREVWNGQTPLRASGASDQHSQLQLYLEGPNDKVFCFLGVRHFASLMALPKLYVKTEGLSYLGGHSLNRLIQAELEAIRLTLAGKGRPGIAITLPRINPFAVGQLIFLWELEAYVCGQLMGINPLDQPGVEEGKGVIYGFLGRKNYESRTQEGEAFLKRENKKYVF
jgi:glucose-6-phosphate isomerase